MRNATRTLLAASLLAAFAQPARADAITDWNLKSAEIVAESKLGTPPAIRAMAIVQTAAYEAANAITRRYPDAGLALSAPADASVDAAIAAAHRATLSRLMPAQQASIEGAYRAALERIADGPAKAAGIAAGEKAAEAVLAARADDGAGTPVAYRPHAAPGSYVPTAAPAVPHWAKRKPWLLASPEQVRPDPPPALTSEDWARDYNEVREIGSKASARRSPAQTEIARFWEYSLPAIYHGVVHSVAGQPGREATQNARLFAAASQAMDDALIAVFDAKYRYHFWRPVTAIRNADLDGNEATALDASWTPFSEAPMHPEYPSGHAILAGAVGAVLQAEIGAGPSPVLETRSPTAKGATRRWTSVTDFMQEVADARVYEGIHYRFSTDAGLAMGRRIGALSVRKYALR